MCVSLLASAGFKGNFTSFTSKSVSRSLAAVLHMCKKLLGLQGELLKVRKIERCHLSQLSKMKNKSVGVFTSSITHSVVTQITLLLNWASVFLDFYSCTLKSALSFTWFSHMNLRFDISAQISLPSVECENTSPVTNFGQL